MIKRVAAWFVGTWVATAAAAESLMAQRPGAPYVPTPDVVVQRMLELAQVGPGDYVIDLGSGDGRIVIQAVQRGARGHGMERNRALVHEARINAERAGVGDRLAFLESDLFGADLSRASVIALYLLPDQNAELRPRLLELRPGTRIVSHGFEIGKWQPDEKVEIAIGPGSTRLVHLWIVPADVSGRWRWSLDGRQYTWSVRQRYQELETTLDVDGAAVMPEDVALHGRHVAFAAEHDGIRYCFSGRVENGRVEGRVHARAGGRLRVLGWHAHQQRHPAQATVAGL